MFMLKQIALAALLLMAPIWTSTDAIASQGTCLAKLPQRSSTAMSGSEFMASIRNKSYRDREAMIISEIAHGNVPSFLRQLTPINISRGGFRATIWVAKDYLAIGSDADFVRIPVSGNSAEQIARMLQCELPTRKIVDEVFAVSAKKLDPKPLDARKFDSRPASYIYHNNLIKKQLRKASREDLVAGHKKDIVWTPQLFGFLQKRVAIYGWHYPTGHPIQPLSLVHKSIYVDYSHGMRLVHNLVRINGVVVKLSDALKDQRLAPLFSDEGTVSPTALSMPVPSNRTI